MGKSATREYQAWKSAQKRCAQVPGYRDRGITMCDEWINSYDAFIAHVGPKPDPSMWLDRIDNDRGYEPGNVRWATPAQQARNTTRNVFIEWAGERLTVTEWADRLGVQVGTLWNRVFKYKWPLERAMTSHIRKPYEEKRLGYDA